MSESNSAKLSVDQIKRIIRKNLANLEAIFPKYYGIAVNECESLSEIGSRTYGLMTRVNILVLVDLCDQLHPAIDVAKSIVKNEQEFAKQFANKTGEAEDLMDRLSNFLDEERMKSLKRNSVSRELVFFVKENTAKMQRLLIDLRAPYGKCLCGQPKIKPFHAKCPDCFRGDHSIVEEESSSTLYEPTSESVVPTYDPIEDKTSHRRKGGERKHRERAWGRNLEED